MTEDLVLPEKLMATPDEVAEDASQGQSSLLSRQVLFCFYLKEFEPHTHSPYPGP